MSLREMTSPDERALSPRLHIDPGFINPRLCFSTFGTGFVAAYDRLKRPGTDHMSVLSNDHLLVSMAIDQCERANVRSLAEVLADPQAGMLFASIEALEGNKAVYSEPRVQNRVLVPFPYGRDVFLEFHTSHFVADTGKLEQSIPSTVAIVGSIQSVSDSEVIARPLIMGAPSYDHPANSGRVDSSKFMWLGWDFCEVFADDIDEFSKMKGIAEDDAWLKVMGSVSEEQVKFGLAEILGDATKKDWGGEQDDHFSTSVHVAGHRFPTAFALKGPGGGKFKEMTPDMLGKNSDQIYRMAGTPAELMVLQHCHQIGEAVRSTLKAFALTIQHPRHYCLIDGKDTYRILKAYGKLH